MLVLGVILHKECLGFPVRLRIDSVFVFSSLQKYTYFE